VGLLARKIEIIYQLRVSYSDFSATDDHRAGLTSSASTIPSGNSALTDRSNHYRSFLGVSSGWIYIRWFILMAIRPIPAWENCLPATKFPFWQRYLCQTSYWCLLYRCADTRLIQTLFSVSSMSITGSRGCTHGASVGLVYFVLPKRDRKCN
jgi:hypothetical protein